MTEQELLREFVITLARHNLQFTEPDEPKELFTAAVQTARVILRAKAVEDHLEIKP